MKSIDLRLNYVYFNQEKSVRNFTPFGVRDFTPTETNKFKKNVRKIESEFEKWDYQQIITPTIEYYKTLEKGMGPQLKKRVETFKNSNGDVMVIRPDHTTPIARLVENRMKEEEKPIRL